MKWTEFQLGENDAGRRIDTILRKISSKDSLSGMFAAVRKGLVRLNGRKTAVGTRVEAGDILEIAVFLLETERSPAMGDSRAETPDSRAAAEPPVPVLYQNEHITAVHKPSGMLVHDGEESLEALLRPYLRTRTSASLSFRPGPLHRLDRNTSGVVCFGTSLPGARWFTESLQRGEIRKFYLAAVRGRLPQDYREEWRDTLKRNHRTTRTTDSDSGDAAAARAVYIGSGVRWDTGEELTLLGIELITGRTHQLRVQAAERGFPILGDAKYGGTDTTLGTALFLHAAVLMLPPWDRAPAHTITAPLPRRWYRMLALSYAGGGHTVAAPRDTSGRQHWMQELAGVLAEKLGQESPPHNTA